MIKRLAIIMVLVFSYMSASAQIATPLLDRVMKVQSPAAAGWRDFSTVGLQAVSADGKAEADSDEIGDVSIGGAIPGAMAALKTEALAAEIFLATDTTKESEIDVADTSTLPTYYSVGVRETEEKQPETRLNLAYVFGEALSLGLGYRVNEAKTDQTTSGNLISGTTGAAIGSFSTDAGSGKTTETGLMVSASFKLAEMFYLAGGMENVSYKNSPDSGSEADVDWSNTILGVGLLVGEVGESRFRAEYSMISSPEVENDDETLTHYKTDYSTMSVEALFGTILLSYINETKKIDNDDEKIVTTQMGAGWMPEEGLSVSAYMFNLKQTVTSGNTEIEAEPKGWRINVGWNF